MIGENALLAPGDEILTGIHRLTPALLTDQVSPYFQSLIDLEAAIANLQDKTFVEPRIRSISQNSPVSFSIEGAANAVNAVKEDVIPWRRKHAKAIAQLIEAKGRAEIEEIKSRVAQIEQQAPTDEERQLQIQKQRLENDQRSIEIDRMKWELQKERTQLALEIVDKLHPNLGDTERMTFAMRLLSPLLVLTESPIEILKPPTLPEIG
jgi:hypothetical protein